MKKANSLGIELLIIAIVLGGLLWFTLGQFELAKARSRDVKRKSDLHEVSKVIRLFYKDYGKLPDEKVINSVWGGQWKDGDYTYMAVVPKEEYLKDKKYCYQIDNNGKTFFLLAELEDKSDIDCSKNGWICGGINYCYRDELEADELIN